MRVYLLGKFCQPRASEFWQYGFARAGFARLMWSCFHMGKYFSSGYVRHKAVKNAQWGKAWNEEQEKLRAGNFETVKKAKTGPTVTKHIYIYIYIIRIFSPFGSSTISFSWSIIRGVIVLLYSDIGVMVVRTTLGRLA